MASFTGVDDTTSVTLNAKGDTAAIALSGTYDMTIALQKELGSPGSGSWADVKQWSTANATVAYVHKAQEPNERLRLIVLVDTSGTCTATITDTTDTRAAVSIGDANYAFREVDSGKVHLVANVSADRTFTLPPVKRGLVFECVAEVGAADGHDWIINTSATADLFKGGVIVIDTDAVPSVASAVVADQSNDDSLQVNVPQGGTWVKFTCDGTSWIVSGTVLATAVPAFS